MTRDEVRTLRLLDYYRSQVNHEIDRSRPPAGYWIRRNDTSAVWGMLSDGDLIPKGKTDVYEEALDACWAHYDELHGRSHEAHDDGD